MKVLHPFMIQQNRKWFNIPEEKMTATFKRVHGMHNHVKNWRNNVTQVGAELDAWNKTQGDQHEGTYQSAKEDTESEVEVSEEEVKQSPVAAGNGFESDAEVADIDTTKRAKEATTKCDTKEPQKSTPHVFYRREASGDGDGAGMLGKRSRPEEDIQQRYCEELMLVFSYRDTMKRARQDYEEARAGLLALKETVTSLFDAPDLPRTKPNSPKRD